MEYTVFKGKRGKWGVMFPNGKVSDVFISEQSAAHHAKTCNEGIAPLHDEIARLKAELAEAQKFIRDVASRNLDISEGYRHVSYNAIVIEAKKQVESWDSTPQDSASRDKE